MFNFIVEIFVEITFASFTVIVICMAIFAVKKLIKDWDY